MSRKKRGVPYPVAHCEWFVQCAHSECGAHALAAPIGAADTPVAANKVAEMLKHTGTSDAAICRWHQDAKKKWWCPAHKPR